MKNLKGGQEFWYDFSWFPIFNVYPNSIGGNTVKVGVIMLVKSTEPFYIQVVYIGIMVCAYMHDCLFFRK